jgi:hypothetical protein
MFRPSTSDSFFSSWILILIFESSGTGQKIDTVNTGSVRATLGDAN